MHEQTSRSRPRARWTFFFQIVALEPLHAWAISQRLKTGFRRHPPS